MGKRNGYWTTRGLRLCGHKVTYPITYSRKSINKWLNRLSPLLDEDELNLELQKGCYITLGNVYRGLKSTHADDLQLCSELEQLAAEAKKDVIIVGDFNFPEIDWDLHHSINNSYGGTVFEYTA